MKTQQFDELSVFLSDCARPNRTSLILFRGQDCLKPLLPKIARPKPQDNTTGSEREILEELRRIGGAFLPHAAEDDWDLLARAQHFQLATRLLDWTTNPLVALWFAVRDLDAKKACYVYRFTPTHDDILEKERDQGPFDTGRTLVYRPNLKNPRILAQSGWFTLHRYSEDNRAFVSLERNKKLKSKLLCWEIPGSKKSVLFEQLDQLGVNHLSLFPDLEGVCRHLNWVHSRA
ncbi:MAG TPA: FRG domain-containing protein [Opitutaceae bacterium]|nr:FRG domain-containing protein [Opitutaceae bacterium]